ncbi:hypothetical protein [Mixta gaviniae]|uniref:hypothetical protein n=1 Tax=Mixta gaviniae TaxID=665914 RepID=UPI00142E3127|nr:hypothetical protein [Mixta gaviniae]
MEQAIHMTHNRLVVGSNPTGATKFYLLNQESKPPRKGGFFVGVAVIGSKMAAEILHRF